MNTKFWECCGDQQGNLLIYDRNQFRSSSSPWKLFLYDSNASTRTLLDSTTNRCACLSAGNVDGNFATWWKGTHTYIYDLTAKTKSRTNPPTGKVDYDPFIVDPTPDANGDETLYFARSRTACGARVSLYSAPLSNLSSTTKLYSLPSGKDTFSVQVDSTTGQNNLFFEKYACKTGASDIFEIENV